MKIRLLLIAATLGTALLLVACASPGSAPTEAADTGDAVRVNLTDTVATPYTVSLEPKYTLELGHHSMVIGEASDGRWLMFGGRVDGFHGFGGPSEDFPNTTANRSIRVYDPSQARDNGLLLARSMDVSNLELPLHTLLTATNYQHT